MAGRYRYEIGRDRKLVRIDTFAEALAALPGGVEVTAHYTEYTTSELFTMAYYEYYQLMYLAEQRDEAARKARQKQAK